MTTTHSVTIPDEDMAFVEEPVASGRFPTVDAVFQAAIDILVAHHDAELSAHGPGHQNDESS